MRKKAVEEIPYEGFLLSSSTSALASYTAWNVNPGIKTALEFRRRSIGMLRTDALIS
jgi:hypothetical protein